MVRLSAFAQQGLRSLKAGLVHEKALEAITNSWADSSPSDFYSRAPTSS